MFVGGRSGSKCQPKPKHNRNCTQPSPKLQFSYPSNRGDFVLIPIFKDLTYNLYYSSHIMFCIFLKSTFHENQFCVLVFDDLHQWFPDIGSSFFISKLIFLPRLRLGRRVKRPSSGGNARKTHQNINIFKAINK